MPPAHDHVLDEVMDTVLIVLHGELVNRSGPLLGARGLGVYEIDNEAAHVRKTVLSTTSIAKTSAHSIAKTSAHIPKLLIVYMQVVGCIDAAEHVRDGSQDVRDG